LLLSRALSQLGQPAAAVEAGQQALALGAAPEPLWPLLAIDALMAGQSLRARSFALRLAEAQPEAWWPLVLAARAAAQAGSESLAAVDLSQAAQRAPAELEPRVLLLEAELGRRLTASERADLAQTPNPCPVALGGLLQVEAIAVRWEGRRLKGTILAQAIRRPPQEVRLFVHLLASSSTPSGPGRAWLGDLWSGLQEERPGAHVDFADSTVPPELWLPGEPLLLHFELQAENGFGLPELWLGIGLLRADTGDRLPAQSGALTVIRDRALVPVRARAPG
jgi:hypothetical protein